TCERLAVASLPAADQPSPGEVEALATCDAEALYYGIGRSSDYAEARRCAYAQRRGDGAPVFGGPEILLMIYANGKGVPRNLDIATQFACEVGGAEAELGGRIAHLTRLRGASQPPDLDICDDVTSGFMGGHCAAHAERVAKVQRDARLKAAT